MYGGNFKQFYGWYIKQMSLRLGMGDIDFIQDYTPDFFKGKLTELKQMTILRGQILGNLDISNRDNFLKLDALHNEMRKIGNSINKEVENLTREEFGFRRIGEGNVSETILTKIIERIYPGNIILKHHRPQWLHGLELDIFLPEFNLGIEYQGQQHFHPVKAWGGIKHWNDCRKGT